MRQPENSLTKPHWTLALTGDVMLGRIVNEAIRAKGPLYPWGNTIDILNGADLTLINLECALSTRGKKWEPETKPFHFRADPTAITGLLAAGVDIATLANNHALDFGVEAFQDTLTVLKKHNIKTIGAGPTGHDAYQTIVTDVRGIRVGMFGATDNTPEWAAGPKQPGVAFVDPHVPKKHLRLIQKQIDQLKASGADVILFSIHWGPNMRTMPSRSFQLFAHRVRDMGVDILHGHSAHVFQGIAVNHGKIIFYDTGDFVDDYYVSQHIDQQFIYLVHFRGSQPTRIELVPILIDDMQVNIAPQHIIRPLFDRMIQRSKPFGTLFERTEDRLFITIPPEQSSHKD